MSSSNKAEQQTREEQYRELMGKAEQLASGQPVVVLPTAPVDAYFFPWEQQQFHANGTTSAEKNK